MVPAWRSSLGLEAMAPADNDGAHMPARTASAYRIPTYVHAHARLWKVARRPGTCHLSHPHQATGRPHRIRTCHGGQVCTHVHAHTPALVRAHAGSMGCSVQAFAHACAHVHARTHARTHSCTEFPAVLTRPEDGGEAAAEPVCTRADMHPCILAHARTRAHTHTNVCHADGMHEHPHTRMHAHTLTH